MPNEQHSKHYLEFESALKDKFLELRPTFNPGQDPSLEKLVLEPVFKRLFIIDRTMITREVFEAGYLLWEECNRDIDKFLDLFDVKLENGKLTLVILDEADDRTE